MTPTNESEAQFLETFHGYLRTLGEDARALAVVVESGEPTMRRYATMALTYLFKSLDLIPDGIDDIGYCDDAFIFRVTMAQALEVGAVPEGPPRRLADECVTVREFLGDVFPALDGYVRTLARGSARGRTVDDIIAYDDMRSAFVSEVRAWADAYQSPAFSADPKTTARLKAFLRAKLH